MSDVVPHTKTRKPGGKNREYCSPVIATDFDTGFQPVYVNFNDSTRGRGTCLGCYDVPCITLVDRDFTLPESLKEFPGDPNRNVCPSDAINWDTFNEVVQVDRKACIGCGLCVSRCPYGAISLNSEGVAIVETSDPDDLTRTALDDTGITRHLQPKRIGQIGSTISSSIKQIPNHLENLSSNEGCRFVRNLLIECGLKCRTRRPGDTNVRIDGVLATPDGRPGVLEIEFDTAVLDNPRKLLEDVAVLHGRYSIEVSSIDPVSVVKLLPNARSEYYQVISDIEKILGLRLRTVTVGVMLVMLWHFEKLEGFRGDLFITSPNDTDLSQSLRNHVSQSIPIQEPYPGTFRPSR